MRLQTKFVMEIDWYDPDVIPITTITSQQKKVLLQGASCLTCLMHLTGNYRNNIWCQLNYLMPFSIPTYVSIHIFLSFYSTPLLNASRNIFPIFSSPSLNQSPWSFTEYIYCLLFLLHVFLQPQSDGLLRHRIVPFRQLF